MFSMTYAQAEDLAFWMGLDRHLSQETFLAKIQRKECYVIRDEGTAVGVFRYGLFWDHLPFLNLIYLTGPYRGRGFGREAMVFWEEEMRLRGHGAVLTSTQIDEEAQHFYRRLGYQENGCLLLSGDLAQPMEVFLIKYL